MNTQDVVVAVQTQAGEIKQDFTCDKRRLTMDTRDATRPLLAALLEHIWGTFPSYVVILVTGLHTIFCIS